MNVSFHYYLLALAGTQLCIYILYCHEWMSRTYSENSNHTSYHSYNMRHTQRL